MKFQSLDNQTKIKKIKKLKSQFDKMLSGDHSDISEEKVRSGYLNKLLEIFGWNLSDVTEVVEEKVLQGRASFKL